MYKYKNIFEMNAYDILAAGEVAGDGAAAVRALGGAGAGAVPAVRAGLALPQPAGALYSSTTHSAQWEREIPGPIPGRAVV